MIQNWLNIVSISVNAQTSMMDYNPNIFWDALKNLVYLHLIIAMSRYHSYKCPVCPVVLCGSPGGALDISSVGVALGCLVAMGSHDHITFPTMVQGIYKYPLVMSNIAMENGHL